MLGKTISHFKIIEKLGEGGMGIVYKAQDLKLDRYVALKFLPQHLTSSEEEKKRFIHEAKTASALDHPNICTIYEIDESTTASGEPKDGQLFICMAYYEGETLKLKIENGRLEIEEAIDIAVQIAEGLNQAHQKDIVHRDVKSANIIITRDGTAKIVDFGLAKLSGQPQINITGSSLGTLAYMSPEQLEGEEVDHQTDIWSLGIILYEMIAGKIPFQGEYDETIIYSILNEDPMSLQNSKTDLNDKFFLVVNRAIEKEKVNRYQQMEDLIFDLRKVQKELESTFSKSKKVIEKRTSKKRILSLLPFTLLIVALVIFFGYIFFDEKTQIKKSNSVESVESIKEKTIAVLPIVNKSGDREQEFYLGGITSQIISNLIQVTGLRVIPYRSVMNIKWEGKSTSEIGRELGVAYILMASFNKSGNRIHVIAELIRTDDNFSIWSDIYIRMFDEIYEVQYDISENIVKRILENISYNDIKKMKTQRSTNIYADNYYVRAKYAYTYKYMASLNVEDMKLSEMLYEKAIELDPQYAPSYRGLAVLYDHFSHYLVDHEQSRYYKAKRDTLEELAYQMDPKSAEALIYIGGKFSYREEFKKAYESYRKALELNSNSFEGNLEMALFHADRGLCNMALKYYNRVLELDPLFEYAFVNRALDCYTTMKNYARAEEDFRISLDMNPKNMWTIQAYKAFLVRTQKFEILKEFYQGLSKLNVTEFFRDALYYALYGNLEEAVNLFENYSDQYPKSGWDYREINRTYLVLGMREKALEYLKKESDVFLRWGYSIYLWLLNDPIYNDLRDDPRFQEIFARHKILYDENLEKYKD